MQDRGKLPTDERERLLQLINSHATLEDRDVAEVVKEFYGGDIDKYLRDMARYLGLPGTEAPHETR
jgi:hypothetical protein